MVAIVVLPTLLLAVWLWGEAGGESEVDQAMVDLAGANAGGPVEVFTGTEHTVYHSSTPLPMPEAPRADGRLTVVWLARTTCGDCAGMRPFAQVVASEFRAEAAFVEKAVDRDAALSQVAVAQLPYFQVRDASGAVLGGFGRQRSAEEFRAALAGAISKR